MLIVMVRDALNICFFAFRSKKPNLGTFLRTFGWNVSLLFCIFAFLHFVPRNLIWELFWELLVGMSPILLQSFIAQWIKSADTQWTSRANQSLSSTTATPSSLWLDRRWPTTALLPALCLLSRAPHRHGIGNNGMTLSYYMVLILEHKNQFFLKKFSIFSRFSLKKSFSEF